MERKMQKLANKLNAPPLKVIVSKEIPKNFLREKKWKSRKLPKFHTD